MNLLLRIFTFYAFAFLAPGSAQTLTPNRAVNGLAAASELEKPSTGFSHFKSCNKTQEGINSICSFDTEEDTRKFRHYNREYKKISAGLGFSEQDQFLELYKNAVAKEARENLASLKDLKKCILEESCPSQKNSIRSNLKEKWLKMRESMAIKNDRVLPSLSFQENLTRQEKIRRSQLNRKQRQIEDQRKLRDKRAKERKSRKRDETVSKRDFKDQIKAEEKEDQKEEEEALDREEEISSALQAIKNKPYISKYNSKFKYLFALENKKSGNKIKHKALDFTKKISPLSEEEKENARNVQYDNILKKITESKHLHNLINIEELESSNQKSFDKISNIISSLSARAQGIDQDKFPKWMSELKSDVNNSIKGVRQNANEQYMRTISSFPLMGYINDFSADNENIPTNQNIAEGIDKLIKKAKKMNERIHKDKSFLGLGIGQASLGQAITYAPHIADKILEADPSFCGLAENIHKRYISSEKFKAKIVAGLTVAALGTCFIPLVGQVACASMFAGITFRDLSRSRGDMIHANANLANINSAPDNAVEQALEANKKHNFNKGLAVAEVATLGLLRPVARGTKSVTNSLDLPMPNNRVVNATKQTKAVRSAERSAKRGNLPDSDIDELDKLLTHGPKKEPAREVAERFARRNFAAVRSSSFVRRLGSLKRTPTLDEQNEIANEIVKATSKYFSYVDDLKKQTANLKSLNLSMKGLKKVKKSDLPTDISIIRKNSDGGVYSQKISITTPEELHRYQSQTKDIINDVSKEISKRQVLQEELFDKLAPLADSTMDNAASNLIKSNPNLQEAVAGLKDILAGKNIIFRPRPDSIALRVKKTASNLYDSNKPAQKVTGFFRGVLDARSSTRALIFTAAPLAKIGAAVTVTGAAILSRDWDKAKDSIGDAVDQFGVGTAQDAATTLTDAAREIVPIRPETREREISSIITGLRGEDSLNNSINAMNLSEENKVVFIQKFSKIRTWAEENSPQVETVIEKLKNKEHDMSNFFSNFTDLKITTKKQLEAFLINYLESVPRESDVPF